MTAHRFNTTQEIRDFLLALPVGTRFSDEIIAPGVYDVVIRNGQKMFRSGKVGVSFPVTAWGADDRITVLDGDDGNLYEKVHALRLGTIFQVGGGDPWIRTRKGVTHLYSVRDGLTYGDHVIPEGWKTYEIRDITVLWAPFQAPAPTPEKTKVYVVTGVDYDCFEIDEVFATREDAEARVVEIKAGRALGVDPTLVWTVEEKEVQ